MFPKSRSNRKSFVRERRAALGVLAGFLLGGISVGADAASEPAAVGDRAALTSVEAILQVPEPQNRETFPVRLDYLVYFHDPMWKVAWGRCEGVENYLNLGPLPFTVEPGQRILLEGKIVPAEVVPATGVRLDGLKCSLLSDRIALPEALSTKNAIGDSKLFNKRWVQVEGLVEQQSLIDNNHLKIDLVSEGRAVTLRLLLTDNAPPPELQGTNVRVQGVYSAKLNPAGELLALEMWVPGRKFIEVLGIPIGTGLVRPAPRPISSHDEFLQVPERTKHQPHPLQMEFLVYFHDARWKVTWGRSEGSDVFLPLGELPSPVKPGQRILLAGTVVPADGWAIEQLKVSLLGDPASLDFLPTQGRLGDVERLDKHPVLVEGYVDQQSVVDTTHLKVDLVSEGRAVTVRLLLDGTTPAPELAGTKVRAKGVYSATLDPTTGQHMIELWVQGQDNIQVVGSLVRDNHFEIPVTPIENLGSLPAGQRVRVVGSVRQQQPGKSLTIRDETGQLTLPTAQALAVPPGEYVEVVGLAAPAGREGQLRECLYRRVPGGFQKSPKARTSLLRLTEQVRELSPEEAMRGHPVQLSGIVTWTNAASDFFFLNDNSGGICVRQPAGRPVGLLVGNRVDLAGNTVPGDFTSQVVASSVVSTARIDLPLPRAVTLEQALTGIEDSQWVVMGGYVRSVTREDPWGRLQLSTSAGEFSATLPWREDLPKLRGSVVRLTGVCSVLTNEKRQLTGIRLWLKSADSISVEEAEPADPFSVVTRSITGLRQYSTLPAGNRRVRVVGVVAHQVPGEVLFLQEGAEGLLVLSRDPTVLRPGDRVEVVGFPGRERNRVVLREAVFRQLAAGEEIRPHVISDVDPVDPELDARLVRVEAVLLDSGARTESNRLLLRGSHGIFEATLDTGNRIPEDALVVGSTVALTGVYQVDYDAYNRPHAARILLRTPQDVVTLRRPSWLTLGRALAAIGIMSLGLLGGFSWVLALRRRVRRQTEQIRTQVESEKAARLEVALARAAKLESLGVLAGGIAHDFNNLLTVVLGNLSLVKFDTRIEAESLDCIKESERAALRARDLTQQLITFAKGGEPVRTVTSLPQIVREATKFALHGSNVRCDYDIAADAWPAYVDQGQISQVVHNLVINASHAMPGGGVIRIALYNEEVTPGFRAELVPGRYLRLNLVDSGVGISPEHLQRIFEPYFTTKAKGHGLGLATVYSIIKKHQGFMEVESALGVGTSFHLWLPASTAATVDTAPVIASVLPPLAPGQAPPRRSARVLIMDDDESIRQLGASILKRMGLDSTGVVDGEAMLREYEAARRAGNNYDLVILDLTVPGGMGGAAAMVKLRQLDADARAIVSSGYSNDPLMADCRAHGFCGAVTKPFDIGEFMKTVSRAVAEPLQPR